MALQYLLAPTFQFVNTAGKPLSGGAYMEVYVHGTRTKYFCASDFNGTLHPFRIPLDSLGSNIVLANDTGSYDVYAYNRYGTLMMSRYNVKPGAGGGIGGTITSTDGSIDIHPTEDGVDLSVNGLDPSCLKVSADPRTTDGKFHFDTLVQEGDQAYVDNEGAIRLIKGWYHFTANVQLAWNAGARNETHQVTLYTTLSNSVIDFDISHVHTETIELSGDVSIAEDGSELVIGVSGMPTGLEASVIGMDVHAITGKDGHDKYYAGNGITISNENYIAADFDEVQEKLVAGQGVTIEGNVISAPSLVQVNSDWNATSGVAEILNKPDLDVFATKTEVNTGLAGKQNTIPDLAAIRSGAQAGASAVQSADLAAVATTGSYNDLNHRPNLDQYATHQELTAGLAAKQDTISDLSAIRAGAQLGATAVQPADLDTYATDAELTAGLSTKQDVIDDLSEIRSGAAAGSTALQPSDVATVATTGDYADLSNKPDLSVYATDTELTDGLATKQDTISDLATIRSGAQAGASAVQPADLANVATTGDYNDLNNRPNLTVYATKTEVTSGLATKQDVISDLSTIRSGAAAGATALQPSDVATVATTGDYDDLSGKPTIPSGTQLVPAATSADADKVLTVDSLGIPGWAVVPSQSTGLFQAQYGVTTYADIVQAINDKKIVYCRLNSGASRMAFLAFIGTTNVEFQYYRSLSSHSASNMTDEVYVYTVSSLGWTTTTRKTGVKVTAGAHMSQSYSNDTLTLNCTWPEVDQTFDAASANAQSGVAVAGALATKQDTISDLATIRSGAAAGATAIQPGDLATVATTGSYDDLSDKPTIPAAQVNADWDATSGAAEILNKPTIPSGTQLVPASTIADADKVLTVDAQGTPAWASAQAPISAGDGISITNDEISAKAGTGLEIADVSESTTDNLVCATMSSRYDSGNWAQDICPMTQALADAMNTSAGYAFTLVKPFDTYNVYAWSAIAKTSELLQDELQNYAFFGNYLSCRPSTDGSDRTYEVPAGTTLTLKFSERDQSSTITVADILADLSSYSLVILWYDDGSPYAAETMLSTAMTPETTATHTTTTTLQDALCVKNPLPASTVSDADKVLTVDSQGTPAWASAQAPISAGNGIDITNNVVSVDTSVVATQTDLADKEDVFNVGTGLEMDTSGATPTLQVEAPVDIVGGPGIVIDNPDGNTLRISTDENYETVLSSGQSSSTAPITLSESMSNFEYVEIYGVWTYNTTQQMKVYSKIRGNSTVFNLCGFGCANLAGDTQDMFMLCSDFSVSGATITVNKVLRQTNSGGLLSRTDGIVITKIVGIHRIAGGN